MAAVIFHGAPGSYKTSSCIWFEMLSALRQGRIVVTNIEGIKPIDEIEKELGEQFPPEADIWRLSTQKRKGRELFRAFFHWCPIGAQIIIDEVQDVYPAERTFKLDAYDYQPIENYRTYLPDEWIERHNELLDDIKPEQLTAADHDDLGEEVFDKHGRIIYPETLKESFMRHRKYNWDIVVCTPDIVQVNMLIRGACESAFQHASKDAIGKVIPYYLRRPRIRQHNPKENGLANRKSDVVTYRKVPIEVHKLYKSTSTGKITASGVGKNPFQTGAFKFGATLVVLFVVYLVWFVAQKGNDDVVAEDAAADEVGYKTVSQRDRQDTDFSSRGDTNKAPIQANTDNILLNLPYDVNNVYISSYTKVYSKGIYQGAHFVLELVTDDGLVYFDSQQLAAMDYQVNLIEDCLAKITTADASQFIGCAPTRPEKPTLSNHTTKAGLSLL